MNLFELSQLIVKSFKGLSSEDEVKQLKKWQNDDVRHQNFLKQLSNEDKLKDDLHDFNRFDSYRGWEKFTELNGLNTNRLSLLMPFIRIAAILILFVSIGGVIYFLNTMSPAALSSSYSTIRPGNAGAILRVTGEQEVSLNDSVCASVGRGNEIVAQIENGQIAYKDCLSRSIAMTIEVPIKSEYQFVLSDGTKAWMNAGSKLRFEYPFSAECREISVEGEVYLEVTKDANRPFVVNLPGANSIEVLGTQFNVKAYNDELKYQAVLVEGSILWRTNDGTERLMEPGQLLQADVMSNTIEVKDVDVLPYVAWRHGFFVFDGERLEDIMTSLSRWYGVKVIYEDEVIKDLHFSVDVKRYENLNDILTKLEVTEKIYFKVNGSEIIVNKYK